MRSRWNLEVMPELRALTTPFSSPQAGDSWYQRLKKYAWFQRRTQANLGSWGVKKLPEELVTEPRTYICTAAVTHPRMVPDLYARDEIEALHILAHFMQPPLTPFHGAEFSKTFLDLVERVFDADTKRAAGKIMRAHKIKTRVVSQETRDRASTRLKVQHATTRVRKMLEEAKQIGT